MNEHCFYRLNIDTTDSLNPEWVMPTPTGDYGIWQPKAKKIFKESWLEYVESIGLRLDHVLLFYRGPLCTSKEAHVDTHSKDLKSVNFGINWVIGGEGSLMHWFKRPAGTGTLKEPDTTAPYLTWQFKDLQFIESCRIGKQPTLVKTCNPHSITMGRQPRWAISARTHIDEDILWDDVVELMRSKKLLVERND